MLWKKRRAHLSASSLIISVTIIALIGFAVPQAKAAGTVYVSPSMMQIQKAGTNITFAIMVGNMPHFKSYDVYMRVNSTVLEPESINITGSVLITLSTELVHCINGAGTGCTSSDGPGVIHSALTTSWPPPVDTILVGELFTITFKVRAAGGTFISIFDDTIIDSATGLPIGHTSTPGVYGTPAEFGFSTLGPLVVPINGSNQSQVTLTSLNGFSGTVGITAAVSSSAASFFLHVSVQPSQVAITPQQSATFTVIATSATPLGAAPGSYAVNIVGSSDLAYNSTSLTVIIPDVYLQYKMVHPAQASAGQTVTLQNTFENLGVVPIRIVSISLDSDFGSLSLFSARQNGITLCGEDYTGAIGVSGQTVPLTLSIPSDTRPGSHSFTVNIGWQYQETTIIYNNPVLLWCDTTPLVLQQSITITNASLNPQPNSTSSNHPGPTSSILNVGSYLASLAQGKLPYVIGLYAGLVVLAAILLVKRKRNPSLPSSDWNRQP